MEGLSAVNHETIAQGALMLARAALLFLALAAPASAQTSGRSDLVRGLCQPEGCDEFAVLGADRVAANEDGTLLRTRIKTFHASRDGRRDLGEENGYVFCSTTKPAIMASQDGRTMAFYLAPFATAESREQVRRNANYHAVYFALCHGVEAGQAAVRDLAGTARGLGYRVPEAQSRVVALNRAEDILGGGERRSADARPLDARPLDARPLDRRPGDVVAGEPRSFEPRRDERMVDERLLPPGSVPLREARRDPYLDEPADTTSIRRLPSREAPPPVVYEEEGLLAAPRRLTDRTLDAIDNFGNWVLGR